MKAPRRHRILWWLTGPILCASLLIGPPGGLLPQDVLAWAWGSTAPGNVGPEVVQQILLTVRLPRVLLGFLVGAGLTVSGTSLQVLVRNPLASPDILGLSAGAAFGAALALSWPVLPLQATALAFALIACAMTYRVALGPGGVSVVSLVLGGVVVTGFFASALTILQMLSDPFRLQSIVRWTMGDLQNASWSRVRAVAPLVGLASAALTLLGWRMNLLALGDEETRAVGRDPNREKLLILVPAALAASAVVAVAGIVGMVGLVVPHLVRLVVGPSNVQCVPASVALGGSFLVLVDDLARAVTSYEIPIGVTTTLLGGPVFLLLLHRENRCGTTG